jgi:hypothetical protein
MEVTPLSAAKPSGRVGHSIVLSGAVLLLVGGYAENFFNDDLWIYNLTTNAWLRKTYYTHALLPATCVDDTVPDPDPLHPPGSVIAVNKSVAGEPTRGMVLDGRFGRASAPVLVPQARRAAPGWDGCVSRQDPRPDLPPSLQWEQPSQRAFHRAVFSEKYDLMLLYGGETLFAEQAETLALTWPTRADGQLWMWSRWACPSNCSLHGDCWYGEGGASVRKAREVAPAIVVHPYAPRLISARRLTSPPFTSHHRFPLAPSCAIAASPPAQATATATTATTALTAATARARAPTAPTTTRSTCSTASTAAARPTCTRTRTSSWRTSARCRATRRTRA